MPESDVVARLLSETTERLKHSEGTAKAALARLTKAHQTRSEIEPRWKTAQKEREVLQQIVAELGVRESDEAALARDAERLSKDLAEIVAARSELDAISTELNIHADLAA